MPGRPDQDHVEFVDPDGDPHAPADDELLDDRRSAARPARRVVLAGLVLLAVAAVVVIAARHRWDTSRTAAPPRPTNTITRSPVPVTAAPASPTTDPATLRRYPTGPVMRAAALACATCSSAPAEPAARAARRALGKTRDLVARSVGSHRALVVAALFPGGAQLLAVVTRSGDVDATRLGIAPPIGVQSQRNGRDTLLVVVSGASDAVALLGRPPVQRWLATLHP